VRFVMKRTVLILLVLFSFSIFGSGFFPGQEEDEESIEGKHYFLNLSLYYPISINQSRYDTANINLSLIYGRVGRVHGLDLSLAGAVIENELRGLQIAGLAAIVGDSGQGIQISGLMSVAGQGFQGIQSAGLINVAGERFTGWQSAGLMNIIGEAGGGLQIGGLANIAGESYQGAQFSGGFNVIGSRGAGFQASGVFNVAGESFRGFQSAGLFSVTGESLKGVQISGLLNVVGDDFQGFQAGLFNVAAHSKGLQIGLANVGETSRGAMIGLVNYTKKENTGLAFGPINIASNGRVRGILWGGNTVAVTAGVKCCIRNVYSMASLGFHNLDDGIGGSITYGFHYGYSFPLNRLSVNTDLGYRYRDNERLFKWTEDKPDQHMLEWRLFLEIPVNYGLSFILGGGFSRIFNAGGHWDSGQTKPIVLAGLELF